MTSQEHSSIFGSLATSFLTGIFAALPLAHETIGLLQRVGTVFILAAAAELGRRAVGHFWKKGKS